MFVRSMVGEGNKSRVGGMRAIEHNFFKEMVLFFKDLFRYMYIRVRQVVVVAGVAGELGVEKTETLKRGIMRYAFWGRGNWYRFAVVAAIGFSVVLLPFSLNRKPVTQQIYAEEAAVQPAAEVDLLVQRGSSQTLIPKGRPRTQMEQYTVQGGDTLGEIAEQWNVSVQTLLWANGMSDYDFIRPGQLLKIPPGDGVLHTVADGDTLSSVAGKYNAAEQAIVDQNPDLEPPFSLVVGQVLFVPEGTMPAPPAPVTIASASNSYVYTPPAAVPSAERFASWPVGGGRGLVTQCPSRWHMAIDIADSSYPPLVAAAAGTVVFAGMSDPWGYSWSVQIDHGNGYTTFYAHMYQISVVSGQYVGQGQMIGTMGASGLATGVHVHFEVRQGVSWAGRVNPAPFMDVHVCGY